MNLNTSRKYLDILQVLRGVAALMVVVHHSVGSLKYYHKIDNYTLDFMGSIGKYGVDFFFVLSGFIISFSAYYKYDEPSAFTNYIKNRLVRIYIPYLPIGIFMLAVYTFFTGFSNGGRTISTLTSLTLLPHGNPALSVAWTLSFELFFYCVFSITFFSKKLWYCFICLWCVIILVFNYVFTYFETIHNPFLKIILSTYNIEFLLGYCLSLLIINKIILRKLFLASTLFILMSLFLYLKINTIQLFKSDLNFLFAFFALNILYIAIVYFNNRIPKTSLLMLIGNASYSIYLLHNPLQMIVLRIVPKVDSFFSIVLVLLLVLFLSCFLGYLYFYVFEKKAISIFKSKIKR